MESVRATNAGRAIAKKVGNMCSKDKSYLGELSGKLENSLKRIVDVSGGQ